MKNDLVVKFTKSRLPSGHYLATITRQKYRASKFFKTQSFFKASCGIHLQSANTPEFRNSRNGGDPIMLFVRGRKKERDHDYLLIPNKMMVDLLKLAILEYNTLR